MALSGDATTAGDRHLGGERHSRRPQKSWQTGAPLTVNLDRVASI